MTEIVHQRLFVRCIGMAPIPLDRIEVHELCRSSDAGHVARLKEDIAKDIGSRWAHPLDVVIRDGMDKRWVHDLSKFRLCVKPPPKGRFWCISGQHRLLAAREMLQEWKPVDNMDPQLKWWPGRIYEAS